MKTRIASIFISSAACLVLVNTAPTARAGPVSCTTVTTNADAGPGSFRNALACASNGDTIDATGISGAITLLTGELLVTNSVTIVGPGPATLAVDGNGLTRVFHVQGGVIAAIFSLTITNADFGGSSGNGGGIDNDNSTLTVSNCIVTGNSGAFGGGIANNGFSASNATLTVIASTVRGNSALSGGGISNLGEDSGSSATLTITNSTLSGNSAFDEGGAVFNVGINSGDAMAEIIDSTLANNSATNRGGAVSSTGGSVAISAPAGNVALKVVNSSVTSNSAGFGGGIFSTALIGGSAKVEITNGTFSRNTATSNGSGIVPNGGGIALGASLGGIATNMVTSTTFRENSAANGGALLHSGNSLLVLANSTVISNSVLGSGGGILDSENSTLIISNSTLSGNSAASDGGGLFVGDVGARVIEGNPTVEIFASTLSENSAVEGGGIASRTTGSEMMSVGIDNSTFSSNIASFGGAILNFGRADGTTAMRFANTTFSGNSASVGGVILNTTEVDGTATVSVVDTILNAGALGNNIDNVAVGSATVTSLGYNLSSDAAGGDGTTGPGGFLNATGDIRNTNPLLGSLQNNGGPTFTHALLAGSPAINAGDPNFTPPPDFDQRGPGFDRVINGRIDIGAFEVQTVAAAPGITCDLQFFTNATLFLEGAVLVTTNACGTDADVGVTTGAIVSVQVEVCADAGNSGSLSNFSVQVTEDGAPLGSGSINGTNVAPGDCLALLTLGSSTICSNAGVHTFAATVSSTGANSTVCTNTIECCVPPLPPTRCPLTTGYWKNHRSAWPVTSLILGCQTYTQAELLKILGMATGTGPKADASLILADQLIAAKLNIANGSDPAPVAATIAHADSLLCGFSGKLPYKVRTNTTVGKAMTSDANVLNKYNNGQLTPNCTR